MSDEHYYTFGLPKFFFYEKCISKLLFFMKNWVFRRATTKHLFVGQNENDVHLKEIAVAWSNWKAYKYVRQ
jgi:hypothetical protein